jgi:hypothetical protein
MSGPRAERYQNIALEVQEVRQYERPNGWLRFGVGFLMAAVVFGIAFLLHPPSFPVFAASVVVAAVWTAWSDTQTRLARLQAHSTNLHDEIVRLQEVTVRYCAKEELKDAAFDIARSAGT